MRTFLHIVNPYPCKDNSSAYKEQAHTLHALSVAKKNYQGEVTQCGVTFPEEIISIPNSLIIHPVLQSSLPQFCNSEKKLPLLNEILGIAKTYEKCEYVIYSNMDIIPSPSFYSYINHQLEQHDALVINRRRIDRSFLGTKIENQYLIFSEAGKEHPGFDCFVFKRGLIDQFELGHVCIGIPHAENTLLHNLIAFSKNLQVISNAHVTFHIGMELHKQWGTKTEERFNFAEYKAQLKKLKPHLRLSNFPGNSDGFCKRHFRWLMHPSFSYPLMLSLELKQKRNKREKPQKEKLNFKNKYLEWLFKKVKIDE